MITISTLSMNIFLYLLLKVISGLSLGVFLHFLLLNGNLGAKLKQKYLKYKVSPNFYLRVFLYIFLFYITLWILDFIVINLLSTSHNLLDLKQVILTVNEDSVSVTENTSNVKNTAEVSVNTIKVGNINIPGSSLVQGASALGNGAIMASSISAGAKFASSHPNIAGKAAIVGGSLALGGLGIMVKDLSGKVIPGKKDFVSSIDLFKFIESSGSDTIDFLYVLHLLHNLQTTFLLLIIYYFLVLTLKDHFLKLSAHLPKQMQPYYIKMVDYINKVGYIYILIFLGLLLTSLFLSNHYFDLFLNHFDAICEEYIKTKTK